jgi:phosphomannomutase
VAAVALGMDNRLRHPSLKEAFGAGVLSTARRRGYRNNHTPLLYFAVAHWKLDGGATVAGSHSLSDNGVKMVTPPPRR